MARVELPKFGGQKHLNTLPEQLAMLVAEHPLEKPIGIDNRSSGVRNNYAVGQGIQQVCKFRIQTLTVTTTERAF
jgi:hypothetical protein